MFKRWNRCLKSYFLGLTKKLSHYDLNQLAAGKFHALKDQLVPSQLESALAEDLSMNEGYYYFQF